MKRVLVLGATGMLGQAIRRHLISQGVEAYSMCRSTGFDLRNRDELLDYLNAGYQYDLCINVAGENGGLKYNLSNPFDTFVSNTQVALNSIEACARNNIPYVGIIASCGYPDGIPNPLSEFNYTAGRPHDSVACHGLAKRTMVEACRFASKQFPAGKFVTFCLPTLHGPGDSFHPDRTKVVGAMVRRMVDAADSGAAEVTCWGTGNPLRELLFVDDAARLIVAASATYGNPDVPLNLSLQQEFSVKQIAEAAAAAAGFHGKISWDTTKPDGQYRKSLDDSRMKFFVPSSELRATSLDDALAASVSNYRERKATGELDFV